MAKFNTMRVDSSHLLNCSECQTFENDRLLRSEEADNAYCKIQKRALENTKEASLYSFYPFYKVIIQAVNIFSTFLESSIGHTGTVAAAIRIDCKVNGITGVIRYERGGIISRNSARDLK